jgi:hypothetical protein
MLRKTWSERSQSLVEFSLVVPILMLLALGIVDFGMGFKSYVELTNATREGARYAVVGYPAGDLFTGCAYTAAGTVRRRVCDTATDMDLDSVGVDYPDGQASGNSVVVEAKYCYKLITPLASVMGFVSTGDCPGFDLSSSSDMRLE